MGKFYKKKVLPVNMYETVVNVEELPEVCKGSSKWHSDVSDYHDEKNTCLYVCMYIFTSTSDVTFVRNNWFSFMIANALHVYAMR